MRIGARFEALVGVATAGSAVVRPGGAVSELQVALRVTTVPCRPTF
jgi:hypothetical protein